MSLYLSPKGNLGCPFIFPRTIRGMIVDALHDEASHQGDIHLLKKLAGVKA